MDTKCALQLFFKVRGWVLICFFFTSVGVFRMNSTVPRSFCSFSSITLKTSTTLLYGQVCINLDSSLCSPLTRFQEALVHGSAFPSCRHSRVTCSLNYTYLCPGRSPEPSIMNTCRLGLRVRGQLQPLFYIAVYSSSVIILLPSVVSFQWYGLPHQYACELLWWAP